MQKSSNHKHYKHGHGSDAEHKKDQALFSHLMEHHRHIKRSTQKLKNGICSLTTSKDKALAKTIQDHVKSMEIRFGKGRAIRSWDPLFAALFEYKDQINMVYENIDNGVKATLTSDDPKIIELIHCHDLTLHNFVNQGFDAGGKESPKPEWLD